jgi:hypothetical protein
VVGFEGLDGGFQSAWRFSALGKAEALRGLKPAVPSWGEIVGMRAGARRGLVEVALELF